MRRGSEGTTTILLDWNDTLMQAELIGTAATAWLVIQSGCNFYTFTEYDSGAALDLGITQHDEQSGDRGKRL